MKKTALNLFVKYILSFTLSFMATVELVPDKTIKQKNKASIVDIMQQNLP